MWKRLKDLVTGYSSSSESSSKDSFSRLAWKEEDQSPYRVRMLDCRSVSRSLLSMTKDASVAQRFAELRGSQGHSHHPIPSDVPDDPKVIALFSFSQYGRWASFATYEDTTRIVL